MVDDVMNSQYVILARLPAKPRKLCHMAWVLLVSECGITALFLWCAIYAFRSRRYDGGRSLSLLMAAVLYAWLFEDLNVWQGEGRGSYSYNLDFQVFFDRVPMFIVLAWAIILWTAMRLSDAAPLRGPFRVLSDAALAVLLDLSFDVTAIRHRFWYWHGVGFNEAWFGVPAGNFFGWLYVSLAYSVVSRSLWHTVQWQRMARWKHWLPILQLLLVPLLSFVLYRALEGITNITLERLGWTSDAAALGAFFTIYGVVVVVAALGKSPAAVIQPTIQPLARSARVLVTWSRATFHIFAIVGLAVLPPTGLLAKQKPALLLIAGLVWIGDVLYKRWLSVSHVK